MIVAWKRYFQQAPSTSSVRWTSMAFVCMGSQSEAARLYAIRLISLRAFQTFLPDWPDLTVSPGTGLSNFLSRSRPS